MCRCSILSTRPLCLLRRLHHHYHSHHPHVVIIMSRSCQHPVVSIHVVIIMSRASCRYQPPPPPRPPPPTPIDPKFQSEAEIPNPEVLNTKQFPETPRDRPRKLRATACTRHGGILNALRIPCYLIASYSCTCPNTNVRCHILNPSTSSVGT